MQPPAMLVSEITQAGFLACFHDMPDKALAIFDGLRARYPQDPDVLVGVATAKIRCGEIAEAVALLRDDVLSLHPDNAAARCMLGWAFALNGQHSASQQLLNEVANSATDESVVDFARALLDEDALAA